MSFPPQATPVSVRFLDPYTRDPDVRDAGQERVDFLGEMTALGLDRLVCFPTRWNPTQEAQAAFAQDCKAAGITLDA